MPATSPPQPGDRLQCLCGCGRSFVLTFAAPHKRFASGQCRNRWHAAEAAKVRKVMREQRGAGASE